MFKSLNGIFKKNMYKRAKLKGINGVRDVINL